MSIFTVRESPICFVLSPCDGSMDLILLRNSLFCEHRISYIKEVNSPYVFCNLNEVSVRTSDVKRTED